MHLLGLILAALAGPVSVAEADPPPPAPVALRPGEPSEAAPPLEGAATSAPDPDASSAEPSRTDEGTEADGFTVDALLGEMGLQADMDDKRAFLGGYAAESVHAHLRDRSPEAGDGTFDAWTRAFLFLETDIGLSTKIRMSADGDFFTAAGSRPLYAYHLEEAYLFHSFGAFQLKLGRQIVTWGVMDAASPEDQVNPRDHRFSIVKARREGLEKVPLLSARSLVPLGAGGTLDLIFVPFFEPDRAFLLGTDFSILRPGFLPELLEGFRDQVQTSVPPASQPAYARIAEGLENAFDSLSRTELSSQSGTLFDLPSHGPESFEGGVRISGTAGRFDFAASALTVHERIPRVRLSEPMKALLFELPPITDAQALSFLASLPDQLDFTFPRTLLFGGDLTARVSRFNLKAEGAFRTASTYYDVDLEPRSHARLDLALHLDYLVGTRFTFILEGAGTHVFGDTGSLILVAQDSVRVLGRIGGTFLRDDLKLTLDWAYEFAYRDFYLGPGIAYRITDRLTIGVGAEIYGGPDVDLSYQRLADDDERAELKFGPFAYYRDASFAFTRLTYGF